MSSYELQQYCWLNFTIKSDPQQARQTKQSRHQGKTPASEAFDTIRNRLLSEMTALEEKRIKNLESQRLSMEQNGASESASVAGNGVAPQSKAKGVDKEDPSGAVFRESWEDKVARVSKTSPYGRIPSWRLASVIVKSGADLRQEVLALQLIREMHRIWQMEKVPAWVLYYHVLVTSEQGGLIETIKNSISLHSVKKSSLAGNEAFTLLNYYKKTFGPEDSDSFKKAQRAFLESLAGYSIACYILQVKDRYYDP
ncbi:Phosphatidylinositol 4-kinase pik1alpha (PI4-kinase)(PtdIns-4-kinase) [Phlyctochytrium bullatum]|nr:Phosphatidylinositol 4-kinase pik1alpha (PI4-kinase)(PtdIns-4-kinase) [Phlyctochytrium bullatum]